MSHILCIGAHPDDNEFSVGGSAARWRKRGDEVRFVSVTNGDKGHYDARYIADPPSLAARRLAEAKSAAAIIGASYQTLGVHDGEVYVDRPTTEAVIRCIRSFGVPGNGPDLVVFNRPLDYHRDHRYTSQIVLDATYMLTVPTMCPDVRHLDRMPVFAYWYDDFRDIMPFRADVVVPVDEAMEAKVRMAYAHESQMFEWLPYNTGRLANVPPDENGRLAMIDHILRSRDGARARSVASSGVAIPENAECIEAFQICEYGRRPEEAELRNLFAL
jgi:LmbE family N-acetylglucosaminyl deacetylase